MPAVAHFVVLPQPSGGLGEFCGEAGPVADAVIHDREDCTAQIVAREPLCPPQCLHGFIVTPG